MEKLMARKIRKQLLRFGIEFSMGVTVLILRD
jgi:hypothetical protein